MPLIQELLQRDLNHKIEEVVQVDQLNEDSIYEEITEYVPTESIRDQYLKLFTAIAEAPNDPSEGVGIWISGFFGSGKSSFAKNLGHVLENRTVHGQSAAKLFTKQLEDPQIASLVELINLQYPTEAVMFDVNKGSNLRKTDEEKLAEIVYRALLAALDYAPDYDIAELEMQLEADGQLQTFIDLCPQFAQGKAWKLARKSATKFNIASAIMHQLDPVVFPESSTWIQSLKKRNDLLTIQQVVERTFELTEKRRPGKTLIFIIDEVGQYVARSSEKIEDLRALVEEFGKQSKNRIRTKKAQAPIWLAVTSQEKLDEVVSALEGKRVEIAKLSDRFPLRVDLAPADIREVASRRVLAKKEAAIEPLKVLFKEHQGQINNSWRLERSTRKTDLDIDAFVQFYPYPPHFVELCIDIMSGIRARPGAMRQLGGSNRTIISQIYQMLVNERTDFAHREIGALVTLDLVYELIEGLVDNELRRDISTIIERFDQDSELGNIIPRVAKVICLLEFVRDLPRTEANIAACLVERVDQSPPLPQVKAALKQLQDAHFIRSSAEGWKLQTAHEKNWEEQRQTHLDPRLRDRTEILREAVKEVWTPSLRMFVHGGRSFPVAVSLNGTVLYSEKAAHVPLLLRYEDDEKSLEVVAGKVRLESGNPDNQYQTFWLFASNKEIDQLVAQLYASRQMITKYAKHSNSNTLAPHEAVSLDDESKREKELKKELSGALEKALGNGHGYFRGVSYDNASLGETFNDVFRQLFETVVPQIYPYLEIGARGLKGNEATVLLEAANLNGLPAIFYDGEAGLELVRKDGAKYTLNVNAPIAREILDFLNRQHNYGEKVTGKILEEHFGGFGYGWERDVLRVVLAALVRAGAIEISAMGQTGKTDYRDQAVRNVLSSNNAFRSAGFAPRVAIDRKILTRAALLYEDLTGEEVDVEEGAIAAAFEKLAKAEFSLLLPVEAIAKAHDFPTAVQEKIDAYQQTLQSIINASSDECVRLLASESNDIKTQRDYFLKVRNAIDHNAADVLQQTRHALKVLLPQVQRQDLDFQPTPDADSTEHLVHTEEVFGSLGQLRQFTDSVTARYQQLYTALHQQRHEAYWHQAEVLRGEAEFNALPKEVCDTILAPLLVRACEPEISWEADSCPHCRATLGQMESDVAAAAALGNQAQQKYQQYLEPNKASKETASAKRVSLKRYFEPAPQTEEEIDEAINALREELHSLLQSGSRIVIE